MPGPVGSNSRPLILALLTILSLFLAGFWFPYRDYADYFRRTKGNLVGSQAGTYKSDAAFDRQVLTLKSDSGLKVECGLLVPKSGNRLPPYPAVILLGGIETGKEAVDYVTGRSGVIIAAPDYPFPKKGFTNAARFIADLPAMRKAALQTVSSTMLLMDYLSCRPDVDPRRIILVGYSFGSPFIPCIATYDRRPAAVAMAFGGGGIRKMLKKNVGSFAGGIGGELIGIAGGIFFRPLEPLRYADKIAPIPLLMINGTRDERIPRECVEQFFEKAKEPKKLIWLDAKHVNPNNPALTEQIIQTLARELVQMGLFPDASSVGH